MQGAAARRLRGEGGNGACPRRAAVAQPRRAPALPASAGHGACIDGVCSCDAGYASFDCSESAPIQRPPVKPEIRHYVKEVGEADEGYSPLYRGYGPRDYGKAPGLSQEMLPRSRSRAALSALAPANELVEGPL